MPLTLGLIRRLEAHEFGTCQAHRQVLCQNERRLRKVISDVSIEIQNFSMNQELETISAAKVDDEVKQVECHCCGLKEDCTSAYITQVEDSYSGKWVCGLCSEAVKEGMLSAPETAINKQELALSSHRDVCQKYNSTTRLNPKLSLTSAMRNIAKISSEKRNAVGFKTSKLARSSSCDPRIDFN
ncbi:hypothetical protein FNV43_RR11574 [Rhamnella rubrinervis]|uniref:DUF1677 family protein n=1 Tax=Rhamnella rubrinervis TaxID=2594499 RepID=A0A8K0H649_9ROSA|nr:hypothetical protein FNV43_RR11574 [Rhamnella rubrinervis]